MATMHQQIPWGRTIFVLDDEDFAEGFALGRMWYFEEHETDRQGEQGNTLQLSARQCIIQPWLGGQGNVPCSFDEEQRAYPVRTIGELLGYMSGPLFAETAEERVARLQSRTHQITILPESA